MKSHLNCVVPFLGNATDPSLSLSLYLFGTMTWQQETGTYKKVAFHYDSLRLTAKHKATFGIQPVSTRLGFSIAWQSGSWVGRSDASNM